LVGLPSSSSSSFAPVLPSWLAKAVDFLPRQLFGMGKNADHWLSEDFPLFLFLPLLHLSEAAGEEDFQQTGIPKPAAAAPGHQELGWRQLTPLELYL
jgi:hypothetical protein